MAHPRRSAERRAFTRGEGACNVEFQAVVRQHKEARAEPSGPFAGIDEREFFALLHFAKKSGRSLALQFVEWQTFPSRL